MQINKDTLKCYRTLKGYKQEDLASAAGLSPSTISLIERGAQDNSKRNTVEALAATLDIPEIRLLLPPPDYLINDDFARKNVEYVNKNIERMEKILYSRKLDRCYFFVSGLKMNYFESLPDLCLYIISQVRDFVLASSDDVAKLFEENSDVIVSTTASVLLMQGNLVLTDDLDTEKNITHLIRSRNKLHINNEDERLRFDNLLTHIRDSRFENNYVRLIQMLELYFFISESWLEIENKESAYDMLCTICRLLKGKPLNQNDIGDINCVSELFATAIIPLEKYELTILDQEDDFIEKI